MGEVVPGPWGERHPRTALFRTLRGGDGDLEQMPSPGQERLIADLVEEICALSRQTGRAVPSDPARWLVGFGRQAAGSWPPGDWSGLIAGLKRRKRQLIEQVRQHDRITPAQMRKIWATLRCSPYLDQATLYQIIAQRFPQARKREGGRTRPSLSRLTRREAGRLLDMLLSPGGAG